MQIPNTQVQRSLYSYVHFMKQTLLSIHFMHSAFFLTVLEKEIRAIMDKQLICYDLAPKIYSVPF